ncbi:nuclear transport factor 2 family protein [Mesorhizobium neociceri]|uniref:Nuclear transport factor 2 family protein n=1 Tax=Mesorhizobium neociceri TaxID=1307853 RepID=A0A838BGE3_9HYPH|nr:nuclear transport factor 2 family protein [Mesorhizobium neociceri]MBA1145117.1 nuclear transport factor 2 family protein [Mesorhizobium neociceri]
MKDVKAIARKFFATYDAHDVDGMLALCANDAQGRYVPYGRDSIVPIRGGLDAIWHAFPQAVPNFRVEVVEILAEGSTVTVQAVMSGPIPADVPGIARKAQVVFIPHAYFLRFDEHGNISRLDAYWDNTVLQSVKPSAV